MYIKDYYQRLTEFKSCLAQKKVSGKGFTSHDDFNQIKCSLIRYSLLLRYISNDITEPTKVELPYAFHDNIEFTLNEHGIGYIEHKVEKRLPAPCSLSKAQAREVRRLAFETTEESIKLITHPKLIDYVATRNKYDYESIMVLLESVTEYIVKVDDVLNYNLLKVTKVPHDSGQGPGNAPLGGVGIKMA